MNRFSSVIAVLGSVWAVAACRTDGGLHCDVFGAPATISPLQISCSMASDCTSGLANGKKAYASLSLADTTCVSPLNATNENYTNSPYKSAASTPLVCTASTCTATAEWPTQVPAGSYFLFVFIDTNGDGKPTPRHDNVPGEPAITISPARIDGASINSASGSLWYNIDATNAYAK